MSERGSVPSASPWTGGGILARRVWVVLLNVVAACAVILLVWQTLTVLSWILVALLIALAAAPAVEWVERRGVRRGVAVLLVVIVGLGLVSAIVATVVPMLVEQGRALVLQAPDLVGKLEDTRPVRWADSHFGVVERLQSYMRERSTELAEPAFSVATTIVRAVFATITIVFLTIFALLFGREVYDGILAWIEPARREHVHRIAQDAHRAVSGYVLGTLVISSIAAVVMGATAALLGVPYFVPLGLAMIVFGLVPYVGSIVGAFVLVLVALATVGTKRAIIALVVYIAYQQLEAHLLQPVVQRRTIRMNPFLVSVALLVGTELGGILGTLLALPVAGILQVIVRDVLSRRRAKFGELAPDERTSAAPS